MAKITTAHGPLNADEIVELFTEQPELAVADEPAEPVESSLAAQAVESGASISGGGFGDVDPDLVHSFEGEHGPELPVPPKGKGVRRHG